MPYVTVPRDLSKVKNKIAMGLTKRQLLGVAAAGAIGLPVYFLLRPIGDLALFFAVIPALPFFLLGFYRAPDGRPLEVVLKNYINVRYKTPRVRSYQTDNIYARLELMAQIQEVIDNECKTAQDTETDDSAAAHPNDEDQTA